MYITQQIRPFFTFIPLFTGLFLLASCSEDVNKEEIFKNSAFSIFPDRVVQGNFEAKAVSDREIHSNYESEEANRINPRIIFKFSINGKDYELPSGIHHSFVFTEGRHEREIPTIKFGTPYVDDTQSPAGTYLKPGTKLQIRLDMRGVFEQFEEQGYYENYAGVRLYKEDFNTIYIAGNTAPMIWDFDHLSDHPDLEVKDEDGDGIYEIELSLKTKNVDQRKVWKQERDLSAYPQVHSNYVLSDALYNLSLEELDKNLSKGDSVFRGTAYSSFLSLSIVKPDLVRERLLAAIDQERNQIRQDAGTGGSYPVSTDRVIWGAAAWELYKVNGDEEWLRQSYSILKNSLDADSALVYGRNGLVRGESSFMDWREQTYPKWMEPINIAQSASLSTNAIHFRANSVLALMAEKLGNKRDAEHYTQRASDIQNAADNLLWLESRGYYGQFLYGGLYKYPSFRSDGLGEMLSVLSDLAPKDRQAQIVSSTPVTPFGLSCIYPQTLYTPAYHNNAVWPFVQAYWALAAKKTGNERALVYSIASIYRPTALFLTNKENFTAQYGDFAGTELNSDEMLWSVAGNLSLVYKVLFGLDYQPEGLRIAPHVPAVLRGTRRLDGVTYRKAKLNIEVKGYGSAVSRTLLDGKELEESYIPADLEGEHEVLVELDGKDLTEQGLNDVGNSFALDVPSSRYENGMLKWQAIAGAEKYKILKNGSALTLVDNFELNITQGDYAEYQVIAVDSNGVESYASSPYTVVPPDREQRIEFEDLLKGGQRSNPGYTGEGYLELTENQTQEIPLTVTVADSGTYGLSIRYANGNGPVNTGTDCEMRALFGDDQEAGVFIFPQRGKGEWSNWGSSNIVVQELGKGTHRFSLRYRPPIRTSDNGDRKRILLDHVYLFRIR